MSEYRKAKSPPAGNRFAAWVSRPLPDRFDPWIRALLIAAGFVELGVPVVEPWKFLVLVVALIIILGAEVHANPRRLAAGVGVVLLVVLGRAVLPKLEIEEGHNVFLVTGPGQVFERSLPPAVFRYMAAELRRVYPPAWRCDSPCWRFAEPAPRAFAFSPEGVFSDPKYSRVVSTIDFDRRERLRLGAINDLRYNFWSGIPNNLPRGQIPYFVLYELPPALAGGELCWRGDVMWEVEPGRFERLRHDVERCRRIPSGDEEIGVYGIDIDPARPLSMKLDPPAATRGWEAFQRGLGVVGAALTLSLLLRIRRYRVLVLPAAAAVSTLVTAWLIDPDLLVGFRIYGGGSDGLTYDSFGRRMLADALAGDWRSALQGYEPVFYSMPGLRYFWAVTKPIFGDTHFAYLLVAGTLPLVLYRILRSFLSVKWSVALIAIFLFTPIFQRSGFAQFLYVNKVKKAFAEPLGYTLFLAGMALTLYRPRRPDNEAVAAFLAGLVLFLATAMRPNLAHSAGLLLLFTAYWAYREGQLRIIPYLGLGFSPILLLPLHNWVFGGQFYLLTSSAENPANMEVPPPVYLAAIRDLLAGAADSESIARVVRQLTNWIRWFDLFRAITLVAVLWAAVARGIPLRLRFLAWLALSQQAVLLFYHARGRYTYLAWILSFLVFVWVWREFAWPRARRWRRARAVEP